ncbi:phosphate ABC transporter substrate-binding protein [Halothermothrix orenii]|uniref:Phosphate-binding protein n=1 Tax=Halothermothrix orenii (strain H 168 / OCM 544 / DSM 9562) TaxID=373903 RepID=B8D0H2_HALOH|nr:phosphate ABC transporter substrate-binding protein [Halothermothrix orenii]ACL70908.1 phosphate binding protein [Halothermothrix orenii H 168]
MFNSKNLIALLVIALVTLLSAGVLASDTLFIQGSSTVLPIAQKAAEVYMSKHDVHISVRGGGSGNGIAALIDGAVDIADASRFIKNKEVSAAIANGIYPVPHRVAKDSIAVVVHPGNPVSDLTVEELKGIYTGKITNWKELGGKDQEIVVVSRDSSSGTFAVFNDIANDGELNNEALRVTSRALLQASNGEARATVADTPGAIGYIGLGYLNDDVKAVKLNGHLPSDSQYMIVRPLYMFTNGWPRGLTKKFIDFILSPEGQKIVKEVGYVPLY